MVVDLTAGTATGAEGSDTLVGINGIQGSESADTLIGDAGPNFIFGGGGDDHIEGRAGDDFLFGDTGTDLVDGGPERDTCFGESVPNCEPLHAGGDVPAGAYTTTRFARPFSFTIGDGWFTPTGDQPDALEFRKTRCAAKLRGRLLVSPPARSTAPNRQRGGRSAPPSRLV